MSTFAREQAVAISAVLKASLLAQKVQHELVGSGGVTKKDKSPVTVADYTSQALISALIFSHFPSDEIVGEEDSSELQTPENAATKANIVRLANEAMRDTLPDGESEWNAVKAVERGEREWLGIIDRGNSAGGKLGRHWALDPIDGTKGFLRGGQYAVCLGLLKDGDVVVGVMGCPNLPVDYKDPNSEKGVIFVAVKGQGAYQRSLSSPTLRPISMSPLSVSDLSTASFCESVEAGHSDQQTNARIAGLLGITKQSVRMDSQAKYCSISRGDGDIYLRLPVSATYEEKIWDHSSGSLLVAEAGGIVSDMNGEPLDFSVGRTLKRNKGVVAAHKNVHARVIEAVQQAVGESKGSAAL